MRDANAILRVILTWCAMLSLTSAHAQTNYNQPPPPNVEWTQNIGDTLPLDTPVINTDGETVALGSYFDDGPVVLIFGYNRCPMLCGEVIQGVLQVSNDLDWKAPDDYEVLFFSVDPTEDAKLAADAEDNANRAYADDADAGAWHFLRGSPEAVEKLTEAAGFGYQYMKDTNEYAHPSGFLVSEPDGTISKYFFGVRFDRQAVRLALADSSQGKLGSPTDKLLILCCQYDPMTGKYGLAIHRVLKVGAGLTILALGGFIVLNLRRERKGSDSA
ncbi:MAG: electron transport protein SCO1/SenC [Puniceicoccaceae bacterium 5H]|nr:MAG: electron transport protein SCO1/SenC [Puniceicoccaceae bacterium 5H]